MNGRILYPSFLLLLDRQEAGYAKSSVGGGGSSSPNEKVAHDLLSFTSSRQDELKGG